MPAHPSLGLSQDLPSLCSDRPLMPTVAWGTDSSSPLNLLCDHPSGKEQREVTSAGQSSSRSPEAMSTPNRSHRGHSQRKWYGPKAFPQPSNPGELNASLTPPAPTPHMSASEQGVSQTHPHLDLAQGDPQSDFWPPGWRHCVWLKATEFVRLSPW